MRLTILTFIAVVAASLSPAAAQKAEGETMLVFDASGSMWGQIEGRAKIEIAKSALSEFLGTLSDDRRMGLIAYGHRREGDCADIEQLVASSGTVGEVGGAVRGLSPKGKTPMADSIRLAAENMSYKDKKATVILLSDGIETCAPDPCAVAASLEQAGADFTTHVIAFDVTLENDVAQLKCLAENTGGRFLMAADSGSLSEALEETVVEAPAVTETRIRLRATELEGGLVIEEGLNWRVTDADGNEVYTEDNVGTVDPEVAPGTYDIIVSRPSDGASGTVKDVSIGPNTWKTVTIALEIEVAATLEADPAAAVVAGADVSVSWTGPDRQSDYIAFAEKGSENGRFLTYRYTSTGNPVSLRAPLTPGSYEIRYMLGRPIRTLASIDFEVTAAAATLDGPDTAIAGETIEVTFTGPPAGSGDWVTVTLPDAPDNKFNSYHYATKGSPATIRMPLEPGDYELRYVQGNKKVLARRPITVTAAEATISGPDTAIAGETIEVAFTGPPAGSGDWVTVTLPDAPENKFNSYHYATKGSPATIRMPLEPGDYELRYVQGNKKVLARQPIPVTAAEATLDGPSTAIAGETIEVEFTAPPAGSGDWVTVTLPDAPENKFNSYHYATKGSPASIRMPLDAGEYELRFVQGNKKVLTRRPITVTEATATLDGPESAVADTTVEVSFTGPPPGSGDYIAVAERDAAARTTLTYAYVSRGSPLNIRMPKAPGDYELRYIQGNTKVLARQPIRVTAE